MSPSGSIVPGGFIDSFGKIAPGASMAASGPLGPVGPHVARKSYSRGYYGYGGGYGPIIQSYSGEAKSFDALDRDHNGVLTRDEVQNDDAFDKMDRNKDGKVTREEWQLAMYKITPRRRACC